ncbi:MAG: APC family permease, partial [Gemmatimonadetes bacterium]|nr:APC family permease [Gemmatimonadota bacterium]NIU73961.1 amino acid permease [Gammaproteobacteria bacterium]NIR80976.1 APC family permease [Gemmatimonadota bacterium]NIU33583.1 APC family permease [Gemmatimonadota bacterium]NIV63916.1 amino acid permease [Gemmatimonadota bacterium]
GAFTLGDFALALVAGLFAFGGWHMVTYNAEETLDPERTIPRALVVGTLVVTACYILLNAVYLYVLPLETVAASDRVAADAADAVLGRGGGMIMSALVVFSTFGALSGIILAGPRVYYAMARDGLLFRWLGEVHPRYRTPHRAIVLQAVWASVLVSTGTYRALFTRVIYTEWIFFGLMAVGLILLRRGPGPTPPYQVRSPCTRSCRRSSRSRPSPSSRTRWRPSRWTAPSASGSCSWAGPCTACGPAGAPPRPEPAPERSRSRARMPPGRAVDEGLCVAGRFRSPRHRTRSDRAHRL